MVLHTRVEARWRHSVRKQGYRRGEHLSSENSHSSLARTPSLGYRPIAIYIRFRFLTFDESEWIARINRLRQAPAP